MGCVLKIRQWAEVFGRKFAVAIRQGGVRQYSQKDSLDDHGLQSGRKSLRRVSNAVQMDPNNASRVYRLLKSGILLVFDSVQRPRSELHNVASSFQL
jgi:hypothetical protein